MLHFGERDRLGVDSPHRARSRDRDIALVAIRKSGREIRNRLRGYYFEVIPIAGILDQDLIGSSNRHARDRRTIKSSLDVCFVRDVSAIFDIEYRSSLGCR